MKPKFKKLILLTVIFISVQLFFSCSNSMGAYRDTNFFAMDTFIYIKAENVGKKDFDKAETEVYDIEKILSKTESNSDVYKINFSDGSGVAVSSLCEKMLLFSVDMAKATDGAFSPTLGALVNLWNIKSKNPVLPSTQAISEAKKNSDYNDFSVENGIVKKKSGALQIDLGAVGKGYAAERAIRILSENGIKNAMISIGGDISVSGNSKANADLGNTGWDIGIKNPFNPAEIIGHINTADTNISITGDYVKSFEFNGKIYHHIIDFQTGKPSESGLKSTAVICKDGATADALSTALFVMGKDKALELYKSGKFHFEAVLCNSDGNVYITDGIKDSFVPNYAAKDKNDNLLTFPDYKR